MEQGDCAHAVVELQREAWQLGEGVEGRRAAFEAGACMWALGDFDAAADQFATTPHPSFRYAEAESRYWLGDHADAGRMLRALEPTDLVLYRLAWVALREHEDPLPLLAQVPAGPLQAPARAFADELAALPPLPHKRPLLAGGLSLVVPGLGQLYDGEPRDALSAFVVNGVLIAATTELALNEQWVATGAVGLLALSFYSGNVFSAVNSAHRYNRRVATARLEDLESRYELRVELADEGLELVPVVGEPW